MFNNETDESWILNKKEKIELFQSKWKAKLFDLT